MEDHLRKKSEKLLGQNPLEVPALSTVEVQQLFHELNAYQVELEMQNQDLRHAQQELSAALDAYVELYETAPVGYLTIDSKYQIIEANYTAATLLGLERGKLLVGRTFSSFVHNDSLHIWDAHQQYVAGNSQRQSIDLALKREDGESLMARVEYTSRPACGQYLMTLTDITQRVDTEQVLVKSKRDLVSSNLQLEQRVDEGMVALAESEEKYRKLFESESDAIMIFDGDTRQIIDVNAAALQLYGYAREEFLQLTHGAITAEPETAAKLIAAAMAGEKIPPFVSQHRKKGGAVFPTEITGFSFSWQGRAVVCGVIRDITDRVAHENEREKNRRELRQLASELSMAEQRERERVGRELHDGVSQLLNSSIIRLNMLKGSQLPESAVESLNTICGIVEEALDETRSLTFELSCPMLKELGLAAALQELCSSMSHEYSVCFEFKGAMELLPMPLDRKFVLYRSTRELLVNVLKHADAEAAFVKVERVAGEVRISIADNGKGFDASTAGMGFSPSGGFGLFNMREYIWHIGGSLEIESAPGGGTEVVLSVPLEQQHE